MENVRRPGQRAGLTSERVRAEARALLADRGLDGLTMRALATRLRVSPNALYSHVAGKTALVDAVLDDVLADIAVPAPGAAPRAGLRAIVASTYDVLLAHPELVPLYLARQGARGPNARRLGEVMLGLLAREGVAPDAAGRALRTLVIYAIGFAAFSSRPPLTAGDERPLSEGETRAGFDSGLDWLLAGILQGDTGGGSSA